MDLAPFLGYAMFYLNSFREIVDKWKKEGDFKNLRLRSTILNKPYSKSKTKKSKTRYSYVRIYLEVKKVMKQANDNVFKACKIIATNRKKNIEYIRRRYYKVKNDLE